MPKKLEVRRGMLEPGELNRFLEVEQSIFYRVIWLLMCDSGLRIGEVLSLQVGEVWTWLQDSPVEAATRENIRVVGKRRKVRYVGLTDRTREALNALWWSMLDLRKWQALEGKVFRVGQRVIQKRFKRVCAAAGIHRSYLCPHSLRHTYATRLLRKGVDPLTVSVSLGHESMQTTMGYLHTNPEMLRRVTAALEGEEK